MRAKLLILFLAAVALVPLAACSGALPTAIEPTPVGMRPVPGSGPAPAQITVQRVEFVAETGRLTFWGESSLPDGTCLVAKLLQEGSPLAWWQAEACIEVVGGTWQLVTPVPHGALEPGVDYQLRVGAQGVPDGEAVFWFDLSGPRNPQM